MIINEGFKKVILGDGLCAKMRILPEDKVTKKGEFFFVYCLGQLPTHAHVKTKKKSSSFKFPLWGNGVCADLN